MMRLPKPKPASGNRECRECATVFSPQRDDQVYCSIDCGHRFRKRQYRDRLYRNAPCEVCGRAIEGRSRRDRPRKVCSQQCAARLRAQRAAAKAEASKPFVPGPIENMLLWRPAVKVERW